MVDCRLDFSQLKGLGRSDFHCFRHINLFRGLLKRELERNKGISGKKLSLGGVYRRDCPHYLSSVSPNLLAKMAKSHRTKCKPSPTAQALSPPPSHNREPSFSTDSQAVFEVQSLPVHTVPLVRLFTGSSLSTSFVVSPRTNIVETKEKEIEDVLVSSDFGGNRALPTSAVRMPKIEAGLVRVRVLAQERRKKADSSVGKDIEKQLAIARIYGGSGRSASFSQPGKRLAGTGLVKPGKSGAWLEGIAGKTMLPRVRQPASRSPVPFRPSSRTVSRQKSVSPVPQSYS